MFNVGDRVTLGNRLIVSGTLKQRYDHNSWIVKLDTSEECLVTDSQITLLA